jgi:hypothetical protein
MAINNSTQATVAFKNLLGKSNTDHINKQIGNEAIPIAFNVHGSSIFVDVIDTIPANAVIAEVAVFVQANLVLDGSSNGHAYIAQWPVTPPAGTDPDTVLPYAYGAGKLTGIAAGDRVQNAISYQFGNGYEAKPFDTGAAAIPVGDPRNWIYQYQSGVFFQQDIVGTTPGTIEIYVYIGNYLVGGGGPSGFGPQYHIFSGDNITVPVGFQYLIYGNLTLEGTLTNYGQIVIINGALINTGTLNNYGSLLFITLSTSPAKKFVASFIANAGVPVLVPHKLNTFDFTYQVRENMDNADIQLTRINLNVVEIIANTNMSGVITIMG